jgi:plastocyanin
LAEASRSASQPVTIPAAGSLGYVCTLHPGMVGTLNVTQ